MPTARMPLASAGLPAEADLDPAAERRIEERLDQLAAALARRNDGLPRSYAL